ncbi:MAG TPA: NAD(+)/NADH kinase [Candidatus Acetothermia bacterium]|jgi:NAD+ kinase|nr:NAD(+)/NADH kinase [Candidatus Acetothermia bacterium]HEX32727.1 NAD(+)/NADH kinase [Candidatus Acetothermia bacterium]
MKISRIYIVANTSKDGSLRTLAVLKAWAQLKRIETVLIDQDHPHFSEEEGALIVALGGDGTVLRAASIFADSAIPILGANLGSLGFLTQVKAPSLTSALEGVLHDSFTIEERMRLAYSSPAGSGTVLNDVVITGTSALRFCELELLWSDGVVASYPGDGLILSTATGATAYNLSAGGPVIVPPAACILASPLAVHKLGILPVIFPAEEVLLVRPHTNVSIYADGDMAFDLPPDSKLTIKRADTPTRLIRMASAPSFFHVLQEKLNWGDQSKREGKSGE